MRLSLVSFSPLHPGIRSCTPALGLPFAGWPSGRTVLMGNNGYSPDVQPRRLRLRGSICPWVVTRLLSEPCGVLGQVFRAVVKVLTFALL
jgi:hypothetical protein